MKKFGILDNWQRYVSERRGGVSDIGKMPLAQ